MNEQESCRWFDQNLNAYLDGELDREARERMNEHARSCPACGQKLETTTRLLTMCAELDEGLTAPLEAQAAWRKAVRAEAESHRRKRRTGAWTRSIGWIAAALTILTVSTAVFRQGVAVPPAAINEYAASVPMGEANPAPADYGLAGGVGAQDSGTLSLKTDGALDNSGASQDQQATDTQVAAQQSQVIIRSASRTIETTAYDTDSQSIDNLVDEYEAYYESKSQSGQPIKAGETTGRERDMTIRVPSDQLDEFLTSLDVIGTITYENETAQDVSSNYYDANARLNALKAQRDQINKLISTATDLTGIVELQDKFYSIQAEIDQLEGSIRGWDSKASYSQVDVHMTEAAVRDQVQPVGDTLIERIRNGFFDSVNWLSGFLQDMVVVLAAAAPVLVVLIPLIVLIWVIVRIIRARRRR
jgi:hypothetical protein